MDEIPASMGMRKVSAVRRMVERRLKRRPYYEQALQDEDLQGEDLQDEDLQDEDSQTGDSLFQCLCGKLMLYKEEAISHIYTCRAVPIQEEYICSCNAFYPRRDLLKFEQHIYECDGIAPPPQLPTNQDISSDLNGLSIGDPYMKSPLARAILRLKRRMAQKFTKGPIRIIEPSISEENATTEHIAEDEEEDHVQLPTNDSHSARMAARNTEDWVDDLEISGIPIDGSQSIEEPPESRSCLNLVSSGGYDSPTEGHSTVTDSDLLSVSDTSEPELCLNFKLLPQTDGHLLDHMLEDYHNWKQSHGSGNSHATPAAHTSSLSKSGASQASSGKRKLSERDPSVGGADGSLLKIAKRARDDSIRAKLLACPYWKLDQEKYRMCCKLSHKRIRDVKQHLQRRHTPATYCDRCLEIFDDDERYEVHVQSAVACFRAPGSRLQGITRAQSKALSRKSKRNLGEEDQWFAIWNVLFPGTKRPASAYMDSELTEEMSSFREYWTNRGNDVLMDELNSSDIWSLSSDQREIQGRQILARGLNAIYERWNDSRRNTSIAEPAANTSVPPSLNNTPADSSDFDLDLDRNHANMASVFLPDLIDTGGASTRKGQLNQQQATPELFQPDPQTPLKPTDVDVMTLMSGENSGRIALFEREMAGFDDLGLDALLATEISQDVAIDFDEVDAMGDSGLT